MATSYGNKSLLTSSVISVGLLVLAYFVVRHSIVFLLVAMGIVLYDIYMYFPRYQFVRITDSMLSLSSVNPMRKPISVATATIKNIKIETHNDLLYTIRINTGAEDITAPVIIYPSEMKELAGSLASMGLRTETVKEKQ
jgi:hypothetical protein